MIPAPASLPSRGAWIEIHKVDPEEPAVYIVAPLAGSVDRNGICGKTVDSASKSLPSRGAWIEMSTMLCAPKQS